MRRLIPISHFIISYFDFFYFLTLSYNNNNNNFIYKALSNKVHTIKTGRKKTQT